MEGAGKRRSGGTSVDADASATYTTQLSKDRIKMQVSLAFFSDVFIYVRSNKFGSTATD